MNCILHSTMKYYVALLGGSILNKSIRDIMVCIRGQVKHEVKKLIQKSE